MARAPSTQPTATASGGRNTSIDTLRAVALLMVLAYHFFPAAAPGGYLGVDIFFAISGFFIARQVALHPDFDPLAYLRRRLLRLLPALATVLLATLGIGALVMLPDAYAALAHRTLYAATFQLNLAPLPEAYFGPAAETLPLLHLWTLGVEMQVYLGAAVALPLLTRLASPLAVFAGLSLAGPGLAVLMPAHAPALLTGVEPFYHPFLRVWEFALGGLAALLPARLLPARDSRRQLLLLLGLAGIVACLLFDPSAAWGRPGPGTAPPVVAAAAVLLCCRLTPDPAPVPATGPSISPRQLGGFLRRSLQRLDGRLDATLAALGRASYSIYLWHWPLLVFWRLFDLSEIGTPERCALLAASIAIGLTSYRLVERPALARFRRCAPSSRRAAAPAPSAPDAGNLRRGFATPLAVALSGLGGAVAVAFFVMANGGLPQRLPAEARAYLASAPDANPTKPACHGFPGAPVPVAQSCRHGDTSSPARVAVWGDSHAMTLAGGLLRRDIAFREFSFSGCPPLPGLFPERHGPGCAEYSKDVRAWIAAHLRIDTVVIAARWAYYVEPRYDNGRGGTDRLPSVRMRRLALGGGSAPASDATVLAAFGATVRDLLGAGLDVVLVYPTPVFGWNIPASLARMAWTSAPVDLSVSVRDHLLRTYRARRALDAIGGHPDLHRVDPLPVFCSPPPVPVAQPAPNASLPTLVPASAAVRPDAAFRAPVRTPDLEAARCSPRRFGQTLFADQDHLSRSGADLLAHHVAPAIRNGLAD